MISTARRIEHATGLLALGLLNEASDELEAIEGADRLASSSPRHGAVAERGRLTLLVAYRKPRL